MGVRGEKKTRKKGIGEKKGTGMGRVGENFTVAGKWNEQGLGRTENALIPMQ
jgi:hypothetical protein